MPGLIATSRAPYLWRMKHVTILVPETAIAAAVLDPQYLFAAVNQFSISAGAPAPFEVTLAGNSRDVSLLNGQVHIQPQQLLEDIRHTDLIIIPALSGDMKAAVAQNEAMLPWIVRQYQAGAEVASLCVGAFLLAATGLMDGKQCSTHWMFAPIFRDMYPEVILTEDRIITAQHRLYSSGGAHAYWNLLLYLVEKYTSREMAVLASKFFVLQQGPQTQSPFVIFKGQKDHGDHSIVAIQEYIEKNYAEKLSVDGLAELCGAGRRTFERRFKKATGNTVLEYLQRVRMEAAKKALELGHASIKEVMYQVGYADHKAFRDIFKKMTGMTPGDYRSKFIGLQEV